MATWHAATSKITIKNFSPLQRTLRCNDIANQFAGLRAKPAQNKSYDTSNSVRIHTSIIPHPALPFRQSTHAYLFMYLLQHFNTYILYAHKSAPGLGGASVSYLSAFFAGFSATSSSDSSSFGIIPIEATVSPSLRRITRTPCVARPSVGISFTATRIA